MKASSVVVAANSRGRVELHTVAVHMVVAGIEVGAAVPIVAVTRTVEVVAAVRIVMAAAGSTVIVAVHRMTTVVGSCHCSYEIVSGMRAVLLLKSGFLLQAGLICSIFKRGEDEFLGDGFAVGFQPND